VLDAQRAEERAKQAAEKKLAYGKYRLALVTRDGTETPLDISYEAAKVFADEAARTFVIDQSEITVTFDPKKMRDAIKSTTEDAKTEV